MIVINYSYSLRYLSYSTAKATEYVEATMKLFNKKLTTFHRNPFVRDIYCTPNNMRYNIETYLIIQYKQLHMHLEIKTIL